MKYPVDLKMNGSNVTDGIRPVLERNRSDRWVKVYPKEVLLLPENIGGGHVLI
jgi:hypothetical protein